MHGMENCSKPEYSHKTENGPIPETAELRQTLIRFVRRKFGSRPGIAELADDIVNEAFLSLYKNMAGNDEREKKENFGYLSAACMHIAYDCFRKTDENGQLCNRIQLEYIDAPDVVEEILQSDDTREILQSLDTLKEIERIILLQRYYGDYTFAEIAEANEIKLNTVLSHHRRALERLRPRLSKFAEDRQKREGKERKKNVKQGFEKWV